jgi:GT2 family glycosyltransferase
VTRYDRQATSLERPAHPAERLDLPGSRVAVPGNRWDLARLDASPRFPPVSVVVPYYDAPQQLERALAGLALQRYPATRYEVIVADDGSPVPPVLPAFLREGDAVPVRRVHQPDQGFRAAAARNLGARAAEGEILCFLDADTVPTPGYLSDLIQLPAKLPDAVVAGRRRHADLTRFSGPQVREWLTGTGPAPAELPEPAWLRDTYRSSGNLLRVDEHSWRYVISAVMACTGALYRELGGFDESFTAYGGEDWELAHRAFNAGAVLAHVPAAVAWHDGPDFAGRGDAEAREAAKRAENQALARLIPEPDTRGKAPVPDGGYRVVDVVVRGAAGALGPGPELNGTIASLLDSGLDLAVYLDPAVADAWSAEAGAHPRVRSGPAPADVLDRCRYQIILPGPQVFSLDFLAGLVNRLSVDGPGRIVVPHPSGAPLVAVRTRAVRRAARWQSHGTNLVERFFGTESMDTMRLS